MKVFCHRLTIGSEPRQLPSVYTQESVVRFSTPPENAGAVYLAPTPADTQTVGTRFAIAPGTTFPFEILRLDMLWAFGTVGDALDMMCEATEMGRSE